MSDQLNQETQLSLVVLTLLKGIMTREQDEKLWSHLLRIQSRVRDYLRVINLELFLDEAEGFAWLKNRTTEEGETELPRLVPRHRLSYNLSLLLALLRRKLAEQDAKGGETRLVVTTGEILDLLGLFLAETSNEARRRDTIMTQITKAEDLGFLKRLNPGSDSWEVRRILGAFIDAQWLSDFDKKLDAYRQGGEE